MPKLIRLYIVNVAIGFALAGAFVAMLIWLDVGHLQHLIFASPMGLVALAMLWLANGIIFAGAQFAIAVMGMAEDDAPRGGRGRMQPIPVPVRVNESRRR